MCNYQPLYSPIWLGKTLIQPFARPPLIRFGLHGLQSDLPAFYRLILPSPLSISFKPYQPLSLPFIFLLYKCIQRPQQRSYSVGTTFPRTLEVTWLGFKALVGFFSWASPPTPPQLLFRSRGCYRRYAPIFQSTVRHRNASEQMSKTECRVSEMQLESVFGLKKDSETY